MRDIWVCPGCRSVNAMRSSRCYACRTPRPAKGMELAAVDAPRREATAAERAEMVTLDLSRRHHTLVLAVLTASLIVSTMVVHAVSLAWTVDSLRILSGGGYPGDLQPAPDWAMAAWIGLGIAGSLAWGIWMGQVAHNVPLLGGGYPIVTPFMAIVEAVIPIYNIYRCPPVMRELTARLSPDGQPAYGLITPWTLIGIVFVGMIRPVGFLIVVLASDARTALTWAIVARLGSAACLLVAGVLAIALITRVEAAQGRRARRLQDEAQWAVPAA